MNNVFTNVRMHESFHLLGGYNFSHTCMKLMLHCINIFKWAAITCAVVFI